MNKGQSVSTVATQQSIFPLSGGESGWSVVMLLSAGFWCGGFSLLELSSQMIAGNSVGNSAFVVVAHQIPLGIRCLLLRW